jgi:hypothetical protein
MLIRRQLHLYLYPSFSCQTRLNIMRYIYVNGNWDSTDPGTIDEVRIYNQALKISEIKKLIE